jgi:hypothetical protein
MGCSSFIPWSLKFQEPLDLLVGTGRCQRHHCKLFDPLHCVQVPICRQAAAGFLPGYYLNLICIEYTGRKPLQYMGFIMVRQVGTLAVLV